MDISTGLGLAFGGFVLVSLIMMGGDLKMFLDTHAFIVIFGGSTAATLIRFPLSSIMHGLPLGMKFVFNMLATFRARGFLTSAQWTAALEAAGFIDVRIFPDVERIHDALPGFCLGAIGATRA